MRKHKSPFMTFVLFIFLLVMPVLSVYSFSQENEAGIESDLSLLELLGISPSAESIDYVQDKTQFQLHTLLTEQRHPATWDLSRRIQKDYEEGLRMLFTVDEDISHKIEALTENISLLEQLTEAMKEAILSGKKICFYGCGATGRLAKQMESTFWRPFWSKARSQRQTWGRITKRLGDGVEERLVGEMTGADRALISSLEGFEDLQLIGQLQLQDRGIQKGDVVICVTEGGETSSVIGFISAALDQWKDSGAHTPESSRKNLYFVYNNPDEKLRPFERSRKILEEPGITKINLTTGPQAITGSTRMQATTIETYVLGHVLQVALDRALREILPSKDMVRLGFQKRIDLKEHLGQFGGLLQKIRDAIPQLVRFGELETRTYQDQRFSTYYAKNGLITVFIDSTERSPTFRLYPLDTVEQDQRKCWIQVWTPASSSEEAWRAFLGRPFLGLDRSFYQDPFKNNISDPYLNRAALESLKNAGNDQQALYDFSFSESNISRRGPHPDDLGVCVFLTPEEEDIRRKDSSSVEFIRLFKRKRAWIALLFITEKPSKQVLRLVEQSDWYDPQLDCLVPVQISRRNDPLGINQQIALKIILNAHSTAVMTRLGKVIGNTMTNVSPSNLKLIGRATYLIQSHVNDVFSNPRWVEQHGIQTPLSYGEANAVLYSSIRFLRSARKKAGQAAEVALSIIHILESLKHQKRVSMDSSLQLVTDVGLSQYLLDTISDAR
jgi:N-acetylmuramic acid 6-phosphate (MurNAc-6-P) etherase